MVSVVTAVDLDHCTVNLQLYCDPCPCLCLSGHVHASQLLGRVKLCRGTFAAVRLDGSGTIFIVNLIIVFPYLFFNSQMLSVSSFPFLEDSSALRP